MSRCQDFNSVLRPVESCCHDIFLETEYRRKYKFAQFPRFPGLPTIPRPRFQPQRPNVLVDGSAVHCSAAGLLPCTAADHSWRHTWHMFARLQIRQGAHWPQVWCGRRQVELYSPRHAFSTALKCFQPVVPVVMEVPTVLEVSVDGHVFSQSFVQYDVVSAAAGLQVLPTSCFHVAWNWLVGHELSADHEAHEIQSGPYRRYPQNCRLWFSSWEVSFCTPSEPWHTYWSLHCLGTHIGQPRCLGTHIGQPHCLGTPIGQPPCCDTHIPGGGGMRTVKTVLLHVF